jgi:Flp pilus assembly protein TadB
MSFTGATKRAWELTRMGPPALRVLTIPLAIVLIAELWSVIVAWYVLFSILLIPYRLLRRGSRNRKRQDLQHREMLAAVSQQRAAGGSPLPPPTQ